ncbi:LysR substrate-binding domain-containing protein [Bacteriovorax sp. DB6_IX]|uniref:LysR substrate-binding domain-containing protein n=1 Tax=Bacteriovorax sp. DB6_IX TaxID=1353530 RepID=UPI000389F9F0|nr:LysR substrate-binding domain-containing protein [Bacteriovorax sp. DB6_IX]EQC52055.1 putative oxidative stress regulatory protein OxyR [Bacteriovorax sp. DB6_IX]
MTITQLEYILAVDKHRHFRKAAEDCHVSQPTLSMQIQKLEDNLGFMVFDRSKNPVVPTVEGEKFIRQSRIVMREFKKLSDIANDPEAGLSGEFRLGVIPTLAPYLVPLFLTKFSELHPSVELVLEERTTEEIISLLDKDELDAAILVTPLQNNSIIERVLFYEPFYGFVSKDHDLYRKDQLGAEDLAVDGLWLLQEGHCFRGQVLNLCSKAQMGNGHHRFESGSLETLKNLVSKDSGYTLVPHLDMLEITGPRKKMVRPFRSPVPTREVSIVYGRNFYKEKIIDALEDIILKSIPKELNSFKNKEIQIVPIN